MAGAIPYGLALYKPEAAAPFKARRSQETQSIAQDVAVLLEAQSASVEGDASGSSSGLVFSVDEGDAASRPCSAGRSAGNGGGAGYRARQLRESPRLTTDLARLSSATAAAPKTVPTSSLPLTGSGGLGRACSKGVTELVAPPPPPPEKRAAVQRGGRVQRPVRTKVQSGGSMGGWYNPIPHAAQRIRACREAAKKAGELPEVMKVLDSKGSRQAWSGENTGPPSPRQVLNKKGVATMQTLDLTIHVPEVPQFEEEKMPDRVSNLAKQLRIPLDTLKQAYEVFWEICTTLDHPMASKGKRTNKKGEIIEEEFDVFQEGEVNIDGFAKVICKLVGCGNASELPDGLIHRSFRDADGNGTKSISFLEFAFWYSRHGFMENMLLTSAQLEVRQLARKYDLPVIEVEQYKKKFDLFDEDNSGMIDYEEFQKLLSTLIKVPAHLELPVARMNQFWAEADRDRSQLISFEEFLLFYYRYFRLNTPTLCPFQEYYRGIRRVRVAYPPIEERGSSKANPKAGEAKKGRR